MAENLPATRGSEATPALADQWEADALAAIESVATPEAAEAVLARIKLAAQAIKLAELGADYEKRWGRIRLLGERRYGELLGPAKVGGPNIEGGVVTASNDGPVSSAERKAQHDARQVASVPEDDFNEYVETAERPTRAGVLRAQVEPKKRAKATGGPSPQQRNRELRTRLTSDLRDVGKSLKRIGADATRAREAASEAEFAKWRELLDTAEQHIVSIRVTLEEG